MMDRTPLPDWRLRALAGLAWIGLLAAAPATPSYVAIERVMARAEADWNALTPDIQNPHAESWRTLFGAIRRDLKASTTDTDADQRLDALRRLYGVAESLNTTSWPRAAELREELRHWLRPRMALAWAEYRALEAAQAGDTQVRDTWRAFIKETLRPAVLAAESADTVDVRIGAQAKVREAIDSVRSAPGGQPLAQSGPLLAALNDLYNAPNVELILDQSAVASAILPKGIVDPGPIFFRGQWSYVTPGPVTGIGFVPTADGIQIAISQALTSVTPIQGFQQQMEAADPRARRATKMYNFGATTRNDAVLTMYVLFRLAGGLQLTPAYNHGVSAAITSTPAAGGGLQRAIATLVGFGQQRITNEVYEGAIGRMQQEVASGAQELGAIRSGEQQARLNAQIAPYIPDVRTIATDQFGVTDLALQTYPGYARAAGRLFGPDRTPGGASMPQPRYLETYEPGITADVHLPSALETAIQGLYGGEKVRSVENLVIEPPAPVAAEGAPPAGQPAIQNNVSYADFLAKIDAALRQNQGTLPNLIRVKRPEAAPVVSTDAQGHLVLLVRDFQLDVPAPSGAARGGITGPPARVYRLQSPLAEFSLDVKVVPDPAGGAPRLSARVADFDPGPRGQVLAINEDEAAAQPLNPLTARVILGLFETRLSERPIDLPLAMIGQQSIYLRSASDLDPSGWMRLVLQPR